MASADHGLQCPPASQSTGKESRTMSKPEWDASSIAERFNAIHWPWSKLLEKVILLRL